MPTEQEAISSDQAHNHRDPSSLHGKRVVICEDEGITLMQLRRLMDRAGLTVAGAVNNGKEGLEIALRERPDIVLMDVGMPVMDGFEAARLILEVYRPCIIMLTGYPNEEFKAQAAALGVSGYVVKPVTSDALIPRIMEALAEFCAP
jgi:CheY-like chemotaxis protein